MPVLLTVFFLFANKNKQTCSIRFGETILEDISLTPSTTNITKSNFTLVLHCKSAHVPRNCSKQTKPPPTFKAKSRVYGKHEPTRNRDSTNCSPRSTRNQKHEAINPFVSQPNTSIFRNQLSMYIIRRAHMKGPGQLKQLRSIADPLLRLATSVSCCLPPNKVELSRYSHLAAVVVARRKQKPRKKRGSCILKCTNQPLVGRTLVLVARQRHCWRRRPSAGHRQPNDQSKSFECDKTVGLQ